MASVTDLETKTITIGSPRFAKPKSVLRRYNHIPELAHINTIDKAAHIIRHSKEPFWGELIKRLYREGYNPYQMEEAFKRAHQSFKWRGQIGIWFQDSRPTCMEQLEFANGDGNPQHVKGIIKQLVEHNCAE